MIRGTVFYRSPNGSEPVDDFLVSLPEKEKIKISKKIEFVQNNWPVGMPNVAPLAENLHEIRITLPNRIARIIFVILNGQMILLHGFIKKTQKTPPSDIRLALDRRNGITKEGRHE